MGELLRTHIDQLCSSNSDYRVSLNVLIKYEIQCLLERLSRTGEEAVVITTSEDPGCPGYLGSVKGERFIQDNKDLTLLHSQLVQYCRDDEPLKIESSENAATDDVQPMAVENGPDWPGIGHVTLSPSNKQHVTQLLSNTDQLSSNQEHVTQSESKLPSNQIHMIDMPNNKAQLSSNQIHVTDLSNNTAQLFTKQQHETDLPKNSESMQYNDTTLQGNLLTAENRLFSKHESSRCLIQDDVIDLSGQHSKDETLSRKVNLPCSNGAEWWRRDPFRRKIPRRESESLNTAEDSSERQRSNDLTEKIPEHFVKVNSQSEIFKWVNESNNMTGLDRDKEKEYCSKSTKTSSDESFSTSTASRAEETISFCEYMKQAVIAKMFGCPYQGKIVTDDFNNFMGNKQRRSNNTLAREPSYMGGLKYETEEALDFTISKEKRVENKTNLPSNTVSHDSALDELKSYEPDESDSVQSGYSEMKHWKDGDLPSIPSQEIGDDDMCSRETKRVVRDFLMSGSMVMFPSTEIKTEPAEDGEQKMWARSRLLRQTDIPSCPLQLKFTCKVCGEVFKNRQFRDLHVKLHESSQNFNCRVCGAGFDKEDEFRHHQELHSEAQLVCENCGYRCDREFRMRAHREICGKPTKVFKCPFCSKPFAAKRYMNIHMKSHDETNINQCPYCPNVYPLKNSLLKHVKKKHGVSRLPIDPSFSMDPRNFPYSDDEMPILQREATPTSSDSEDPMPLPLSNLADPDQPVQPRPAKRPRIGPAFTKRDGGRYFEKAVTNLDRKNALKQAKSPVKPANVAGSDSENAQSSSKPEAVCKLMMPDDSIKKEETISPKIITLQRIVESERRRRSVERLIKKEPQSPSSGVPSPSLTVEEIAKNIKKEPISLDASPAFESLVGSSKAQDVKTTPSVSMNVALPLAQIPQHSRPKLILTLQNAKPTSKVHGVVDLNANRKTSLITSTPIMKLQSRGVAGTKAKSLVLTITTCYICRQEFSSYELLKAHIKTHSEKDKLEAEGVKSGGNHEKVSCGLCGLQCAKKDMNEHFKTHGIELDMVKEDSAAGEDSLMGNESITNEEDLFNLSQVPVDDMSASNSQIYADENDDSNGFSQQLSSGNIACGVCNAEIAPAKLANHVDNHNRKADRLDVDDFYDTENSACVNDEGKPVMNTSGIQIVNKIYKCKKCAYKTDRGSRVKEHCRTCYHTDSLYGCKLCGKAYRIKRNMIRHMKSHSETDEWSMTPDGASGSKKFRCEKCYYETSRPSRFKEHLQLCGVTNEQYECPVCGKQFKVRRYLNKHMKRHISGDQVISAPNGTTVEVKRSPRIRAKLAAKSQDGESVVKAEDIDDEDHENDDDEENGEVNDFVTQKKVGHEDDLEKQKSSDVEDAAENDMPEEGLSKIVGDDEGENTMEGGQETGDALEKDSQHKTGKAEMDCE
ncbi:ZSA5B-like protein [Mya arenaria]|uniref:ZSA5B-like protein n=1 Tax=Mya arenaria TaxID=6604 RepID=A0ABY7GED7_MYAAR|nr:ZSA5B-like protein [Mya arenaria]